MVIPSCGSNLQFGNIEATFMMAVAFDRLAVDRDKMAMLIATPGWQEGLIQEASKIELSPALSSFYENRLQYPDQPSPEKRPINKLYLKSHGSIMCNYIEATGVATNAMEVVSASIRLFESGAIGLRCSMTFRDPHRKYDVDSAVTMLRESRATAHKLLFEAAKAFVHYWNGWNPQCRLVEPSATEDLFLLY